MLYPGPDPSPQIRVSVRIAAAGDLVAPALSALGCRELTLDAAQTAGLGAPLTQPLHRLLLDPAFQRDSGITLTSIQHLPGEALDWAAGPLQPYRALQHVSFEAGDCWLSFDAGCFSQQRLGRFANLIIAAGSLSVVRCSAAAGLPPISGPEPQWSLPRFAAVLEPLLRGSAIRRMVLLVRHACVVVHDAQQQRPLNLIVSRHTQAPALGITLSGLAPPARTTATSGQLSAALTRPAPGNPDAVLIEVWRHM